MLCPRQEQEASAVEDAHHPPNLPNQIPNDRQQDNYIEPESTIGQEASIKSLSGNGPSLSYPFDSQSSLENEDGGLGMHHNIIRSLSRN